eukprot:7239725-Ditylum_brightwellii.AAC.1
MFCGSRPSSGSSGLFTFWHLVGFEYGISVTHGVRPSGLVEHKAVSGHRSPLAVVIVSVVVIVVGVGRLGCGEVK